MITDDISDPTSEIGEGSVSTNVNFAATRAKRRGRPSLAYDADFEAWLGHHHPTPISARSRRKWWWAWQAVKILRALPEGETHFAWILDARPVKVTVLAELGRLATRHGSAIAAKVSGVICRQRYSVPKAARHARKACELFDECLELNPVVRPAAWDRRPSAGGAP